MIESLDETLTNDINNNIKVSTNTIRDCHIAVDGSQVKIKVGDKTLLFAKTEIKRMFESLYSE